MASDDVDRCESQLAFAGQKFAMYRERVRTLKRERKALIQAAHTAHGSPGFEWEREPPEVCGSHAAPMEPRPEPTERCWKRTYLTPFDGPVLIDQANWCDACKTMAAKTAELRAATRACAGAGRSLDYAAKRLLAALTQGER